MNTGDDIMNMGDALEKETELQNLEEIGRAHV